MLVTLKDLLPQAANAGYAVPCFNSFGYEDARAIIEAAEELERPIILAVNKDMVEFMGVKIIGAMLNTMAENSSVRVCVHLDHTYEENVVYQAMNSGFSSVMFDGSQLPLEENIRRTRQVAEVAGALGVSVEGEIGSVPYSVGRDHIKSISTEPDDARRFAQETGVDAMAVAVGNTHRLEEPTTVIDYDRLKKIETVAGTTPLVIHGTTGIRENDLLKLKQTRVSKFNIGTSLRMAFGHTLRHLMNEEPTRFDRLYFMKKTMPYVGEDARRIIKLLG